MVLTINTALRMSAVNHNHMVAVIMKRMSEMLIPPGIRNCGNICFASSILQCLFNQGIFRKAVSDVGELHIPSCEECKGRLLI